jgi:hypothetical protein
VAQTGNKKMNKNRFHCYPKSTSINNFVDQEYKQSLQLLTTAYTQWYDEWRDVCDIFQSLEERRLHYLRSSLWA